MFDYLVVIGLLTKKQDIQLKNLLTDQEPEIQHIYPVERTLPAFLENLKLWCFPDGVVYYSEELKRIDGQVEELHDIRSRDQLLHFVLTDEKLDRRYCTSLLYYYLYYEKEKIYVRNEHKHVNRLSKCMPKVSIKQIISNPLILDEDTQLVYAPKALCLISKSPVYDLQRQFLVFFYNTFILEQQRDIEISQDDFHMFEQLVLTHGLSGAEIEMNKRGLRFISGRPVTVIQERTLLEFYISILFTIDRNWPRSEVRILFDVNSELLRFRLNDGDMLSISNFAYKPLFSKLSFVNIMRIVISIIYEKQLLFFSSSPGEISQITEGLLSFIRPLRWTNIYIPCSNICIWEYATALQPYIIGFDRKHKEFIQNQIQGRVIIDLDEDSVVDDSEEFKIPEELLKNLKEELRAISLSLKYSPQQQLLQWMQAILKTKKAFLNFILRIIGDVLPYIIPVTERQEEFMSSIKSIFKLQEYIDNHQDPKFIEPIAKNTMIFSALIQSIDDFVTFDKPVEQSIKTYVSLQKNNNCFTDSDIKNLLDLYQQPHDINLYPWLIKYTKYLELLKTDNATPKAPKEITLHFFDENARSNTRLQLNQRENKFASLNLNRIVNLEKIFTQQRVNSLVGKIKLPMIKEIITPLLKRNRQVYRSSTTIIENQEGTKTDIKMLMGVLDQE